MTDLSEFGGGVEIADEPDEPEEEQSTERRSYRNGRCPAISVGSRKRCRSPVSRMKAAGDYCGTHGRENHVWTIHDDPEELILLTGELDALALDDLDSTDVDFDLDRIRAAVDAVTGDQNDA